MDAKDKRIAELESRVATLEAEKKKKKKRDKTKFALANLDLFKPILDTIKKQERYVFTRKGKEQVIKINEFISDLLVAKIKLGGSVPDKQIGTRLSMDEHSLIKFLSKDRATKEGAGTKKQKIVKQAKPKPEPIAKPKPEAKPIAQPQAKPQPAVPSAVTKMIEGGFKRTPDGQKVICPYPSHDRRSDQWLNDHPQIDADLVVFKDSVS